MHEDIKIEEAASRIAKVIAARGYCSRRAAEDLISQKRVRIGEQIVHSPAINVAMDADIYIDNKKIPLQKAPRLWLLNKPPGYITTESDEQGRPTVYDILPKTLPRVITVGRLDCNTEGLLVLTTCGELKRKLELPKNHYERIYKVRAFGQIPSNMYAEVKKGVEIDGIKYAPGEITLLQEGGINHWFEMKIYEGKNREVRKIFEYYGLTVNRLIRTSYGPFRLGPLRKGELQEININKLEGLI